MKLSQFSCGDCGLGLYVHESHRGLLSTQNGSLQQHCLNIIRQLSLWVNMNLKNAHHVSIKDNEALY